MEKAGIVCETKLAKEPAPLIAWFEALGVPLRRIRLEAGPCRSGCCYPGQSRPALEWLETRHVRDAFEAMPVKTDRQGFRSAADHHATAAVLRSLAAGT